MTNTRITEATATKAWDDNNNASGKRPDSVTFILKADGVEKDRKVVGEADNWTATFGDLNKCAGDYLIDYTIEEIATPGYTTAITGSMDEGFTITNTLIPEEPTPTPTPNTDA